MTGREKRFLNKKAYNSLMFWEKCLDNSLIFFFFFEWVTGISFVEEPKYKLIL